MTAKRKPGTWTREQATAWAAVAGRVTSAKKCAAVRKNARVPPRPGSRPRGTPGHYPKNLTPDPQK